LFSGWRSQCCKDGRHMNSPGKGKKLDAEDICVSPTAHSAAAQPLRPPSITAASAMFGKMPSLSRPSQKAYDQQLSMTDPRAGSANKRLPAAATTCPWGLLSGSTVRGILIPPAPLQLNEGFSAHGPKCEDPPVRQEVLT